ncbi:IG hypothetical 18022 [Mesobacillus boroniphilus JCM 21738]|uniref:IG hypothetical 18022 n=1 Tax=Mesobacillus boroniphilus JCM 21738 TaxID=1294265 RepID=W4RJ26_9BACI|nr:IG hypothetical 18022 [Mesobacillus boroniphilus JCM 21738]
METSLQMLSEYDGKLLEKEQIDIEYKYFFGDLVQVKGYGSDLFKVVGFRTEIWRYKEEPGRMSFMNCPGLKMENGLKRGRRTDTCCGLGQCRYVYPEAGPFVFSQ